MTRHELRENVFRAVFLLDFHEGSTEEKRAAVENFVNETLLPELAKEASEKELSAGNTMESPPAGSGLSGKASKLSKDAVPSGLPGIPEALLLEEMKAAEDFELKARNDRIREEIIEKALAVDEKKPLFDEEIGKKARGWKLSRIGRAELNIIRLALYEIRYDDSVPQKVALNEAVELAKRYCLSDAPSFVNGMLAGLVNPDGRDDRNKAETDSGVPSGKENVPQEVRLTAD